MTVSSTALPGGRSWANVLLVLGLLVCSVIFLWQLPFFARLSIGSDSIEMSQSATLAALP
jgi:hypothetical protein